MIEVIIGCNENKRSVQEILTDLFKLGFILKDTMTHIGHVYGELPGHQFDAARRVKGVYSVVRNRGDYSNEEE